MPPDQIMTRAAKKAAKAREPWRMPDVQYRDPQSIKPNPRNARTHSDEQIDLIAGAFVKFGPLGPVQLAGDNPADLSTMKADAFAKIYASIIKAAISKLKADRFAVVVVGDYRSKAGGFYTDFVSTTIRAFEEAGARFYNQAILVTACGSLPIRARRQFEGSRKLGMTHQHVLVFCNGDPVKATKAIGPVEFGALETEEFGEEL